jgi:hypothetical protein
MRKATIDTVPDDINNNNTLVMCVQNEISAIWKRVERRGRI